MLAVGSSASERTEHAHARSVSKPFRPSAARERIYKKAGVEGE